MQCLRPFARGFLDTVTPPPFVGSSATRSAFVDNAGGKIGPGNTNVSSACSVYLVS